VTGSTGTKDFQLPIADFQFKTEPQPNRQWEIDNRKFGRSEVRPDPTIYNRWFNPPALGYL
jgi:hypothetical protein